MTMKIAVIGASGTIGSAVADALSTRHEVVRVSRHGGVRVDLEDPASVRGLFDALPALDAVVSCAGSGAFAPLEALTDDDLARSLRSKLMGQVNLARAAIARLRDGGSITLTTGILARQPAPGSAAITLVNAGLEGFVRAAALELPRGLRINAVSPPWVKETLRKMGRDDGAGLPAEVVARAYVAAVEGTQQGAIFEPAAG
jgi:NAD(P)-dependent dehydrogenase (short-subunit alcohol dehydrogenase family)